MEGVREGGLRGDSKVFVSAAGRMGLSFAEMQEEERAV